MLVVFIILKVVNRRGFVRRWTSTQALTRDLDRLRWLKQDEVVGRDFDQGLDEIGSSEAVELSQRGSMERVPGQGIWGQRHHSI